MFRLYQPVQSALLSPPTSKIAFRSASKANSARISVLPVDPDAAPSCSRDDWPRRCQRGVARAPGPRHAGRESPPGAPRRPPARVGRPTLRTWDGTPPSTGAAYDNNNVIDLQRPSSRRARGQNHGNRRQGLGRRSVPAGLIVQGEVADDRVVQALNAGVVEADAMRGPAG